VLMFSDQGDKFLICHSSLDRVLHQVIDHARSIGIEHIIAVVPCALVEFLLTRTTGKEQYNDDSMKNPVHCTSHLCPSWAHAHMSTWAFKMLPAVCPDPCRAA